MIKITAIVTVKVTIVIMTGTVVVIMIVLQREMANQIVPVIAKKC